MPNVKYRPEIDGLRAFSVIAVLLFHLHTGVSGGYIGVDVFFVISGFLITRLIISDLSNGSFSIVDFWERRMRRIFPALSVLVACSIGAGCLLLLPRDLEALAKSAVAQTLLISNFFFWDYIDYFTGPADLMPLLHTWSLAVEEQFYLIFPLLLVGCRRLNRRRLVMLLLLLTAISFAVSVGTSDSHPAAAFYLLPARAWELLIGALVALVPDRSIMSDVQNELLSWTGLTGMCVSLFVFDKATVFPGASALVPCGSAALIIFSNSGRQTAVAKLLSARPLVFIGLQSYSLYLWHWPVLAFIRYVYGEHLTFRLQIAAVAICAACSVVSWRFVEIPFRRRSLFPNRTGVFACATVFSMVICATSLGIWRSHGLRARFSGNDLRLVEEDGPPIRHASDPDQVLRDQVPVLGVADTNAAPTFLLWGDSHAMAICQLVDHLASERGLSGYVAARPGTVPAIGVWRPRARQHGGPEATVEWNQAVLQLVRKSRIKHVILVSRWEVNLAGRPDGDRTTLIADRHSRGLSADEAKAALTRGLSETVEELSKAGATVWIMRQVPQQNGDFRRIMSGGRLLGSLQRLAPVSLEEHLKTQRQVDEVLRETERPNVRLLDPAEFCFDRQGRSLYGDSSGCYYSDYNHLSQLGAEKMLRGLLTPVFDVIANESTAVARESSEPLR